MMSLSGKPNHQAFLVDDSDEMLLPNNRIKDGGRASMISVLGGMFEDEI